MELCPLRQIPNKLINDHRVSLCEIAPWRIRVSRRFRLPDPTICRERVPVAECAQTRRGQGNAATLRCGVDCWQWPAPFGAARSADECCESSERRRRGARARKNKSSVSGSARARPAQLPQLIYTVDAIVQFASFANTADQADSTHTQETDLPTAARIGEHTTRYREPPRRHRRQQEKRKKKKKQRHQTFAFARHRDTSAIAADTSAAKEEVPHHELEE